LIAEASRLSGIKTKKDLVHEALRVFIAGKKRKSLLDLAGKIKFSSGHDYKALRKTSDRWEEPMLRPVSRRVPLLYIL
jgi:Arc/MetJ family transcription regulator